MTTFSNTLFVGKVLLELNKIDSTNKHALKLLSKNKPSEGTVISAWNQEQGRGQIGRTWQSEPGKNLTFSIILYPTFLPAKKQFLLNQAIALGISDAISTFLPDVKVKWPNDIYIGNEKVCGVLIQNILSGTSIQSSIIGIGLNVNQTDFAKDLPNPSSLGLIAKKEFDLLQVLERLCEKIETRYLQLRGGNYDLIEKDYLKYLYRLQEESLFQYPEGEVFSGSIVGVSETGKLKIHHKKGEELFDIREVKFII